jgi:HAD superfamily hydrolase (TIGR01549 family)
VTAGEPIRAILFDAGGTLIHVDGERLSRAAGVPYSDRGFARAEAAAVSHVRTWIVAHPDSTDQERLPLFLDTILRHLNVATSEERRSAAERVVAEHRRANLWSRPSEGARETLEVLQRRGYRLAVVSNADGRVRSLLESALLAPFFEWILDSTEVGLEKPDPRIFQAAAERLALPPEACAYVGDIYEIDVIGARRAGLRPILIGPAPAPEPVERIERLQDLLGLFTGEGMRGVES